VGEFVALALDLGSTRFKAGRLSRGRLGGIESETSPPLIVASERREGDPDAHLAAAERLLGRVAASCPPGTPLGIASQRSTFLLWDRRDGRPATPLVSWQDRRAAGWCATHRELEPEILARSGLVLSAHYAGPKLAAMQQTDTRLADTIHAGRLLFGTLETYLVWRWSGGRVHQTDLTMAARTAMVDLEAGDWSPRLLGHFGVPRSALPSIETSRRPVAATPRGLAIRATLADQAAAAAALFRPGEDTALVNLGAGAFVLRPAPAGTRRPGYLLGPFRTDGPACAFAAEGAINGAAAAVDRFGPGPSSLPLVDPDPEAFCLPDAGIGAPYWRPELGPEWSPAARRLDRAGRRRVALEGIVFRVRQVLEGLGDGPPRRVLVSGGLAGEPFSSRGLAALLDRPIELLRSREAGLVGAARLAADLDPFADPATTSVEPDAAGAYLRDKFARWLDWLGSVLG